MHLREPTGCWTPGDVYTISSNPHDNPEGWHHNLHLTEWGEEVQRLVPGPKLGKPGRVSAKPPSLSLHRKCGQDFTGISPWGQQTLNRLTCHVQ